MCCSCKARHSVMFGLPLHSEQLYILNSMQCSYIIVASILSMFLVVVKCLSICSCAPSASPRVASRNHTWLFSCYSSSPLSGAAGCCWVLHLEEEEEVSSMCVSACCSCSLVLYMLLSPNTCVLACVCACIHVKCACSSLLHQSCIFHQLL